MIDPRQNVEVNDETIAGKGFEHIKREITKNSNLLMRFFIFGLKNVRHLVFM